MNSIATLLESEQISFQSDELATIVVFFEQLLEQQPENVEYHLPLGLAYLLMGQEEAAHLTWAIAFSAVGEEQENRLFQDLVWLFQTKIHALEEEGRFDLAYLLYQHLHEINPWDINTILYGLQSAIQGQKLDSEAISDSGLLEALSLQSERDLPLEITLLEQTLETIIFWDPGDLDVLSWIENVSQYLPSTERIAQRLSEKAINFRQHNNYLLRMEIAPAYVEAGLRLHPNHFGLKFERILIHIQKANFRDAALLAEQLFLNSYTNQEKVFAKGLLIKSLFYIPERWKEAEVELKIVLKILDDFIYEYEEKYNYSLSPYLLLNSIFYYQYTADNPEDCRVWQNRLSAFYLKSLRKHHSISGITLQGNPQFSHTKKPRAREKLRVGFLSKFMTQHSIGWLSRWIFQHYDTSRFEFYVYLQNQEFAAQGVPEFSKTWFVKPATHAFIACGTPYEIAQSIYGDEIDILIDLDSITSEKTYAVMALKPAPVQVTWLGYDASGLPTIDYFLVDPLVVPDDADRYYTEKLWRLPETYIAVDHFEVGTPTLQREALDIPADAVIYFSAQAAAKRHPEIVRSQVQILKHVPNSFLFLKSIVGDTASLQTAFLEAAEAEGLTSNRFRFLELDKDEPTHRANLGIADVILDTFPYSGATTTLEALWMGIPLVTRVGQQFSSRNSYAMLRQVGVEVGIARSAEEYVEWGIKFGTHATLREQVRQQLWRSRQTSPLWNAKQFTRNLENTFEQMWQQYIDGSSI